MAAENKTAPLSFRASEEVKQRFQAIAEAEPELKANDILEKLLSSYEQAKQEQAMPEYEKDFKDFAAHLNSLNTSFHNAVHMINNAEQVAAMKFARDLEEKKASIEALTEQVNSLKQEKAALLEQQENLKNSQLEALAKSEASEATAKELQTDKEDLRKQIEGLNDQVEEYKKKEQDLAQINSDLQVKLKETESFAEQIASLNKDLQDHKHLVELKEIELKNCTDNFQSLKAEHDKTLKGLDDVRSELNTCKQEIGHLDSQLQAKTATLESVNSQLELERSRSAELQNKYFALAEASNRKAE